MLFIIFIRHYDVLNFAMKLKSTYEFYDTDIEYLDFIILPHSVH